MEHTVSAAVGANVRAELARRGLSQTDLAKHLGMSQTSISKRLRGEVSFNVDETAAAAEFLGLPVLALMTEHTEVVSA